MAEGRIVSGGAERELRHVEEADGDRACILEEANDLSGCLGRWTKGEARSIGAGSTNSIEHVLEGNEPPFERARRPALLEALASFPSGVERARFRYLDEAVQGRLCLSGSGCGNPNLLAGETFRVVHYGHREADPATLASEQYRTSG
jgi:hypothetical protein